MASIQAAEPIASSQQGSREIRKPVGGLRFDGLMIILCYWWLLGTYLDGWAHQHGQVDESFFTPWHGVLYSGSFAISLFLAWTQLRNTGKGYHWLHALPEGYPLAWIGVGIFFIGGAFDFVWHSLFGIEANMEALLSPAHLLLALGAFLFISAPLRAAWQRREVESWKKLLPALLSLAAILSLFSFFSQYANLATRPMTLLDDRILTGDGFYQNLYGVMSIVSNQALLMGLVLFAIRRWTLPTGAVSLIWTINVLLMFFLRFRYNYPVWPALLAVPLAALLADFLLWRFKQIQQSPNALRLFAFVVPFFSSLSYLLLLNTMREGLWWKVHMWMGVPVIAGTASLLLSFLLFPPKMPAVDTESDKGNTRA
jgi:hypothetical protein